MGVLKEIVKGLFGKKQATQSESVETGTVDLSKTIHVDEDTSKMLTRQGNTAQETYASALVRALSGRSTVKIDDLDDVSGKGATVLPMDEAKK